MGISLINRVGRLELEKAFHRLRHNGIAGDNHGEE